MGPALRAFADVSTEFSMSTVPIANSVGTSAKAPIPVIPVSMVTGRRELSQLDPLHTAFAGGRREILHACSRFNRVSSSHIGFMHDEPDRSEFMDVDSTVDERYHIL